ncbi:MAG: hypothetical protein JO107_07470 [Hyphomicrobiales bacterium]|nr:hypothetical protein [Hyphomicrobiales bacterium]
MTIATLRVAAGALLGAGAMLWLSPAFAHAVCGDRIFPATLAIGDPGVTDELAPTLTYLPQNSAGVQEFDATFSWSKTITPNTALVIQDGATWLKPGGYGWDSLNTELQWGNFCLPDHELIATVGFDIAWGNTAAGIQTTPINVYRPVIDVGKGFGDLPKSLNILRPLAVTAELSESLPGQAWTDGNQNSTNLNWGFTIQYSLPYYNSNVGAIDNAFFKHLIPIAEFAFSKPISNYAPGQNLTTGTFQPGAVYLTDKWQFALEAIVPMNSASGRGVGVVGQLDLYLDDLLPNTLGKPIFPGVGAPL